MIHIVSIAREMIENDSGIPRVIWALDGRTCDLHTAGNDNNQRLKTYPIPCQHTCSGAVITGSFKNGWNRWDF